MIPHPAAWDTYLTTGAALRPTVKVTAYRPGGASMDVPVTGGSVKKDASTYPRTSARITCADTSLVPQALTDLLQPNGAWLTVDYGYTDPGTDLVSYIRIHDGPITSVSEDRPGSLLMIESKDPSVIVASEDMPYTPFPGNGTTFTYLAADQAWWLAYLRTFAISVNTLTAPQKAITVPTDYNPTGDPWAVIEYLMDLIGGEAWFDPNRQLILRPIPVVGSPVFAFRTGETGTITGYQTTMIRPYNQVQLRYGGGIVGEWSDQVTTSPTYAGVGGKYGLNTLAESRPGTPSQVTADAAAKAYATRVRGRGRSTFIRAVPTPWLEPGDTVSVTPMAGATENVIVQSVEIPLDLDVMTLTTRNPVYSGIM